MLMLHLNWKRVIFQYKAGVEKRFLQVTGYLIVKASTSTRGPLVTPSPTLPPGLDLGRALSTCCRPPTRPVKRQKQLRPCNYHIKLTLNSTKTVTVPLAGLLSILIESL